MKIIPVAKSEIQDNDISYSLALGDLIIVIGTVHGKMSAYFEFIIIRLHTAIPIDSTIPGMYFLKSRVTKIIGVIRGIISKADLKNNLKAAKKFSPVFPSKPPIREKITQKTNAKRVKNNIHKTTTIVLEIISEVLPTGIVRTDFNVSSSYSLEKQ